MKKFEKIEKEFLEIKDGDHSSFLRYYYENIDFFSKLDFSDKETGIKKLWMLTEIVNSAFRTQENNLINKLPKPIIRGYKKYTFHYNYDLKSDNQYKQLLLNYALDCFNNKRYFQSTKYFREKVILEKGNYKSSDMYNISKYKLVKYLGRIIGISGLVLLIIKYFSILIFDINKMDMMMPGFLGALFLIGYGIMEMTIKKPSH